LAIREFPKIRTSLGLHLADMTRGVARWLHSRMADTLSLGSLLFSIFSFIYLTNISISTYIQKFHIRSKSAFGKPSDEKYHPWTCTLHYIRFLAHRNPCWKPLEIARPIMQARDCATLYSVVAQHISQPNPLQPRGHLTPSKTVLLLTPAEKQSALMSMYEIPHLTNITDATQHSVQPHSLRPQPACTTTVSLANVLRGLTYAEPLRYKGHRCLPQCT
jgi:hypothetical protein